MIVVWDAMTERVGLYLRVSTKNGQTVDNQRQALTEADALQVLENYWTKPAVSAAS